MVLKWLFRVLSNQLFDSTYRILKLDRIKLSSLDDSRVMIWMIVLQVEHGPIWPGQYIFNKVIEDD